MMKKVGTAPLDMGSQNKKNIEEGFFFAGTRTSNKQH